MFCAILFIMTYIGNLYFSLVKLESQLDGINQVAILMYNYCLFLSQEILGLAFEVCRECRLNYNMLQKKEGNKMKCRYIILFGVSMDICKSATSTRLKFNKSL